MLRILKALTLSALLLTIMPSAFAELDSKNAIVTLEVAKFAKISGLENFVLLPVSTDGDANSVYSGFDMFNLESNAAVSVTLTGDQLSNGENTISTAYELDEGGLSFDTDEGIHNEQHKVSAEAILGEISAQEAGGYSAQIVITVAAL